MGQSSKDLRHGMWAVENVLAWVSCPHCGSEDVTLEHLTPFDEYRPIIECQECGASGYFE